MSTFKSHPTPNPNSFKITTSAGSFVDDGMISFASAEEAENHPLGRRLFALADVENVFAMPDFLTITKTQSASWRRLFPKVKAVLGEYFQEKANEGKRE